MRWTNREIAEDLISDIFKGVSRQLRNPNVTVEIPEIFTKSGEVKKVMTKADLESLRNVPYKQRLYYTYPDTGEKIPYSEYQRRRAVLQRAERRARKQVSQYSSIDTTIIDNFLDPKYWRHYTPLLGEQISAWLYNVRSKYDNNLSLIVKGLELASNSGELAQIQAETYDWNSNVKLPKLLQYFALAKVRLDQEDERRLQEIDETFGDVDMGSMPDEFRPQLEEERYRQQFGND